VGVVWASLLTYDKTNNKVSVETHVNQDPLLATLAFVQHSALTGSRRPRVGTQIIFPSHVERKVYVPFLHFQVSFFRSCFARIK
jgi:hypothetical protein